MNIVLDTLTISKLVLKVRAWFTLKSEALWLVFMVFVICYF